MEHAKLDDLKATYIQECDQSMNINREDFQELKIWLDSQGAGKYFVLETRRWAFDDIQELIDVLKDFKRRARGVIDE